MRRQALPPARSSVLTLDMVPQNMRTAMLSAANGAQFMMDAATAGGMAFLEAELEKRDPKVREPLTSVTWMRDIVMMTGGGFVDYTSVFHVDYQVAGPNQYGIMGGQTTLIPVMQTDVGKDIYPVFNWSNILRYTFVDMKKAQQVGRSLDDLLDKGIRLNWNKSLDLMVYGGWGNYPGILNDTSVYASTAAAGSSGSTQWLYKTPEEILYDVNQTLITTWANSQYDMTGMADYILIPPAQYGLLTTRLISTAGNRSVLDYLLENNIGKNQGRDLQIFPCRWCIGTNNGGPNGDGSIDGYGANGSDRMCSYVNDPDRLYGDITVPINRAMTMPNVSTGAYETLYIGQIGVVKKLFLQTILYTDGI